VFSARRSLGFAKPSAILYREASFDRLADVLEELTEIFALGGTAGERGDFSPVAALFRIVMTTLNFITSADL